MPTSLDLDDHLAAVDTAGHRLIDLASAAGMDAPVPTCPSWDVRALLAHQAMVHRWATAHVRGDDPDAVPNQSWLRTEVDDLLAYATEALGDLLRAVAEAPADLVAMTFLNDAPAPREFWARRQAHETTVHMVDALAAALGRLPAAAEAAIALPIALDGIDELLRGFFTRGRSKLGTATPMIVEIAPDDADERWVVHVADVFGVEPPGSTGPRDGPTVHMSGPGAEIYRWLWNRGGDVAVDGDPEFARRWREHQRVRWS